MDPNSKLFNDLIDKEEVTIVLNSYGLDSIPKEIRQLKKAKSLTISFDTLEGWTIYPPLSALNERIDSPPFNTLPDEITELKNLERLTIHGLDIARLPDNFGNLENLEHLDLSMNKLTVSNELVKLKGLKNLKYLSLFGNRIDTLIIKNWRNENPDIKIDYGVE
jgi:Leucine-rich repeat (LRR) protein